MVFYMNFCIANNNFQNVMFKVITTLNADMREIVVKINLNIKMMGKYLKKKYKE